MTQIRSGAKYRRNQVVHVGNQHRDPVEFYFYGRVVKRVDDENYLVVCTGKHFQVIHQDRLRDASHYKGCWGTPHLPDWKMERPDIVARFKVADEDGYPVFRQQFFPMTSMRRLKQNAAYYALVWRKQKLTRKERMWQRNNLSQ